MRNAAAGCASASRATSAAARRAPVRDFETMRSGRSGETERKSGAGEAERGSGAGEAERGSGAGERSGAFSKRDAAGTSGRTQSRSLNKGWKARVHYRRSNDATMPNLIRLPIWPTLSACAPCVASVLRDECVSAQLQLPWRHHLWHDVQPWLRQQRHRLRRFV